MTPKALAGLKVLDFGQIVAGGHLSAVLADFGAEVVKIESLQGESLRYSGPYINGESGFFIQENRGKKSLSIDLKKPEAVALIKELLPKFDVLIENFRPGTMAKFGLDYQTLKEIKPDLIYVSVSGFGQNNSRTLEPAYDIVLQAASGLARQTGTMESGPMRVPASLVDYTAALNGVIALLAALRYRDQTGVGQYIDVAMYDSLLSIMDNSFVTWERMAAGGLTTADWAQQEEAGLIACGGGHPGTCPHGNYPTKDGYVAHMSLSEKMWQALCEIIGRPDLASDETLANPALRRKKRAFVDEAIAAWTREHTTKEVVVAFTAARLPVSPVRTIAEAAADPHNKERNIFTKVAVGDDAVHVPNFPAKLSITPAAVQGPAPTLGQHSGEVLGSFLGFDENKIAELREKGIIK